MTLFGSLLIHNIVYCRLWEKQMKKIFFFSGLILGILFCMNIQADQPSDPDAFAKAFYDFHFKEDMVFSLETLNVRSQWLVPDLMRAALDYVDSGKQKEEGPGMFDPFTGASEYPDTFTLEKAKVSDSSARVPATIIWIGDVEKE